MNPEARIYHPITSLLILITLSIMLTACTDSQQSADKYLKNGISYINDHQYDKARVELKNAAQINPKNPDVYAYLGIIEENRNEAARAIFNYRKSIELGSTLAIPHTKLAYLYFTLAEDLKKTHKNTHNEYIEQAKSHMNSALEAESNNQETLILKALIENYYGNTSESLSILSDLHNKDRSSIKLSRILADTLVSSGRIEDAEKILTDNIKSNPDEPAYKLELVNHYKRTGNSEDAIKVLHDSLNSNPELHQIRLMLVDELNKQGKRHQAIHLIKTGFEENKFSEQAILGFADKLAAFNRPQESIVALKDSALYNESAHIRLKTARLLLGNKQTDNAIYELEKIIENWANLPVSMEAHKLLGEIYLSVGNRQKTEQHIQKILEKNPDDYNGLLLSGKYNLAIKNYENAINDFRLLLKSDPDDIDIRLILANSYRQNNQLDLYENEIKLVNEFIKDAPDQLIKVAQLHIKNREYEDAKSEIDRILKTDPDNIASLILKSELYYFTGDINRSLTTLDRINSIQPENPVGWFRKARIYRGLNNIDKAIHHLEIALSKDTESDDLLAELTDLEMENDLISQSIKRLESLIQENSKHQSAYKFLGIIQLKSENSQSAKYYLEKHHQINPYDYTIYSHLAGIYESEGNLEKALSFYLKDMLHRPASINSILSTASLYEKTGNIKQAINLYEKALSIDKNHIIAANNLAVLLINRINDDSSLKRANSLITILETKPELAPVQDTIGWIHYHSGRFHEAHKHLENAISMAPDIPTFNYHFGMNQIKMGHTDTAIKHLRFASKNGIGRDKINADEALASLASTTSSTTD